eukprot:gene9802-biopygen195
MGSGSSPAFQRLSRDSIYTVPSMRILSSTDKDARLYTKCMVRKSDFALTAFASGSACSAAFHHPPVFSLATPAAPYFFLSPMCPWPGRCAGPESVQLLVQQLAGSGRFPTLMEIWHKPAESSCSAPAVRVLLVPLLQYAVPRGRWIIVLPPLGRLMAVCGAEPCRRPPSPIITAPLHAAPCLLKA